MYRITKVEIIIGHYQELQKVINEYIGNLRGSEILIDIKYSDVENTKNLTKAFLHIGKIL